MVIAIASQKGGTGKSSTSISLAAGLAHLGKKTLLIDIDSQANSSKVLLHNYQSLKPDNTIYRTIMRPTTERAPLPIHQTLVPNLSVVPSHILLADTDIRLTTAIDHREARLKTELDQVKADYDFILIDCPPTLSWSTINALTAADKVIVTVAPGYFELDSIVQISKTIEQVHEYFNPQIELLGFLFTMSDPTITTQTSLKILRQTYTQRVLQTIIPRNTDLRDAHFNRQDIFSFNPEAKAARAYRMLISELFHL
ncbi:MAG: ParA family protein [Caldilineaceae bacterium]|nr:ParA family protein [Caldilineaceae bacterium]